MQNKILFNNLTQEAIMIEQDSNLGNTTNQNLQDESTDNSDDSFDYVDCGYQFIESSNSEIENEYITTTKMILQKNEENICKLEVLNMNLEKQKSDVNQLENEVIGLEQMIIGTYNSDNYNLHMIKQHNKDKFVNLQQYIDYFYFLLSKSIIYDGWHTFHCVQCMQFVTTNKNNMQKNIQNYLNLKQQILNLKSIS